MVHKFEAFQFLSRKTVDPQQLQRVRTSPLGRDDLKFVMTLQIEPKPFELAFAQLKGARPSIGAHEHVDPDIDKFMARRWLMCLSARGEVDVPDGIQLDFELRRVLLLYPRVMLWSDHAPMDRILPSDQRALKTGYRRLSLHWQMFDIAGIRRPAGGTFVPTDVGEPVGPGVVTFRDLGGVIQRKSTSLFGVPYFRFRTVRHGRQTRRRCCVREEIKKHYNSNAELEDAERHLTAKDVKGAVRSAASAVDAIVRYYRWVWNIKPPPKDLPFDEKVDDLLQGAGRPTYRSVDNTGAEHLRYLYRCRNSMHEGDCYYKDDLGNRVDVVKDAMVAPWVKTVERFIVWIDSLA